MSSFCKLRRLFFSYSFFLALFSISPLQAQGLLKAALSLFSLFCLTFSEKSEHTLLPASETTPELCYYNHSQKAYRPIFSLASEEEDRTTKTCRAWQAYCQHKLLPEEKGSFFAPSERATRQGAPYPRNKKRNYEAGGGSKVLGSAPPPLADQARRLQSNHAEFFIQQGRGNSLTARFENQIDSHYYNGDHILVHECSFSSFSGLLPCITRLNSEREIRDQAVYGDGFNTVLPVDFSEITSTNRLLVVCRRNNQQVVHFWVSLRDLSLIDSARIAHTEGAGDNFNPNYVAYGLSLAPYDNGHFILGGHEALNDAVFVPFQDLLEINLFPKQYDSENLGSPIYRGLMTRGIINYLLTNNGNGRCTFSITRSKSGIPIQRNRILDPTQVDGIKCLGMGIERKSDADKRYYIAAELFPLSSGSHFTQNETLIFYLGSKDRTLGGNEPLITAILQQYRYPHHHRELRFISTEQDAQVYAVSIYNDSHLHMNRLTDGVVTASMRYDLRPYHQIRSSSVIASARYLPDLQRIAISIQSATNDAMAIYLRLADRWQGPIFSVDRTLKPLLPLNRTLFGLIKTEYDCDNLDCFFYSFSSNPEYALPFNNFAKRLSSYSLVITNYYTGAPTLRPTATSLTPTGAPTNLTVAPTQFPSERTKEPTHLPTAAPTNAPTASPTFSRQKNFAIYRITFPETRDYALIDFQNLDAQNKALFISLELSKEENRPQLLLMNDLGLIEEDNSRIYRMVLFSELYPTKFYPGLSGGISSTQAFVGYQESVYRTRFFKQGRSGEVEGVFQLPDLAIAENQIGWRAYNASHQLLYAVVQLNKENVYLLLCSLHFFDQKLRTHDCLRSSPRHAMRAVGDVLIEEGRVCGLLTTQKFKDSFTSLLYYCWDMRAATIHYIEIKESCSLEAAMLLPYQSGRHLAFVNIMTKPNALSSMSVPSIYLLSLTTEQHHINCTIEHRKQQQLSYAAATQDDAGNWYLAGGLKGKLLLIQLKGCYASWAVTWSLDYSAGIKMRFDGSSPEIMRLVIPEAKAIYYTYFYLKNGSNHLLKGRPLNLLVREVQRTFIYQASNDIRFTREHLNIQGASIQSSTNIIAKQVRERASSRNSSKDQEELPTWAYALIGTMGGFTILTTITASVLYYLYKKKKINLLRFS